MYYHNWMLIFDVQTKYTKDMKIQFDLRFTLNLKKVFRVRKNIKNDIRSTKSSLHQKTSIPFLRDIIYLIHLLDILEVLVT